MWRVLSKKSGDEDKKHQATARAPVQRLPLKGTCVGDEQPLPRSRVREKQYDIDYKTSASNPRPATVDSGPKFMPDDGENQPTTRGDEAAKKKRLAAPATRPGVVAVVAAPHHIISDTKNHQSDNAVKAGLTSPATCPGSASVLIRNTINWN